MEYLKPAILLFLSIFILGFFIFFLGGFNIKNLKYATKEINIGKEKFDVKIADNFIKQHQGLSGLESLPEKEGMLFLFQNPTKQTFWMKDMKFPLDFVWILNNKIIEVSENIQNPKNTKDIPSTISPDNKYTAVLEINAGEIKKFGIKVGDDVVY